MTTIALDINIIENYRKHLYAEERSKATISKYMRDIKHFYDYLPQDKEITKEKLVVYKQSLLDVYKVTSINSMLASLNGLLVFMKLDYLKLKFYPRFLIFFYPISYE